MKKLLVILSIGLISGAALAAAPKLVKTTPENGSVGNSAPSAFVLEFNDPVTLTAVYLKKDGDREKMIPIGPQKDAKTITVAAPELVAGHYLVEWVVFTHQSTALTGRIQFTVAGAAG